MKTTQDLAFNRLLKKLSALRATLQGDERNLLDGMITSPTDEVTAHAMNVKAISPAKTAAQTASPDEAKALAMNVKAVSAAKTAAQTASPDEAKALAMNVKAVSVAQTAAKTASPDEAKALAMSVRIVYDPIKDEYQRIQ